MSLPSETVTEIIGSRVYVDAKSPVTVTGSIIWKPFSGWAGTTWITWLDGGGGTWMQARPMPIPRW